jgi:hypothetical protein
MSTPFPPWLEKLHTQHPRPHAQPTSTPPHLDVEPGQIRRLLPMDPGTPAALVLVTASDRDREAHTVVLISPDTDFGGDTDLLLSPVETGLAYDALIQTEVTSYAWTVQLDAVHGQVDVHWLNTVVKMQGDEPTSVEPDVRAGGPVTSRRDPRWPFKVAELERLTLLTGECTRQLVDDADVTVADPESLQLDDDVDEGALVDFLYQLVERVSEGSVVLPGWVVSELLEGGLAVEYRQAHLIQAFEALRTLENACLLSIAHTELPEAQHPGDSVVEWVMRSMLEQQRSRGLSSVHLYCRETGQTRTEPTVRMWTGTTHVQAVRTPCHT